MSTKNISDRNYPGPNLTKIVSDSEDKQTKQLFVEFTRRDSFWLISCCERWLTFYWSLI